MFGDIKGESCGWPKGTVRACVALTTIPLGFIASTTVMIILIIKEQYTIALGINSVIWGLIGTIIGHYFGSKQAEGAAKMISQNEHELIESRNMEMASINAINGNPRGIYRYGPLNNNNSVNNNSRGYPADTVIPIQEESEEQDVHDNNNNIGVVVYDE